MNNINKRKIFSGGCRGRLTFWLLLLVFAGCTKVVPPPPLKAPDNSPDSMRDVSKVLDSLPGFSLFAQACQRASINGQLDPGSFYTLFVPTDSAMTAAGLTIDVINSMSLDSLRNLLEYHITNGAVSDTTLINAIVSIQQNCLLETTFFGPQGTTNQGYATYRHSLFVKYYGGLLNINGWAVNAGERPVKAANGYLYAVHQVLQPPAQLLSDIVFSRPELSYYAAAINIMDSVYRNLNPYNPVDNAYEDTILFSQLKFETIASGANASTTRIPPSSRATVFAPTNTAFINAGIPDIPALRSLILSEIRVDTLKYNYGYLLNYIPGSGNILLPNGGVESGAMDYFPIDSSTFKMHYLFNTNLSLTPTASSGAGTSDLSFTNLLCYSDLTGCPSINNGILNVSVLNVNNSYNATGPITPYTLQFYAGAGGQLIIQWNAAGINNAVIPQDKNQQERNRNFWTMNGVIYESDRLFYSK